MNIADKLLKIKPQLIGVSIYYFPQNKTDMQKRRPFKLSYLIGHNSSQSSKQNHSSG